MSEPTIIAILGAECTGKSTLAAALAASLAGAGIDAVVVPEYLREFCAAHGRTPRADEQRHIAREQTQRIHLAAARHTLVIADTTSLITAVYSQLLFEDSSLVAESVLALRACRVNLLTGLDIAWAADGLQRDSPAARERMDTHLRYALLRHNLPFSVVYGVGGDRLQSALGVVRRCLRLPQVATAEPRWRWNCQHCGDAAFDAAGFAGVR